MHHACNSLNEPDFEDPLALNIYKRRLYSHTRGTSLYKIIGKSQNENVINVFFTQYRNCTNHKPEKTPKYSCFKKNKQKVKITFWVKRKKGAEVRDEEGSLLILICFRFMSTYQLLR